jgi:hypothetical protein
MTFTKTSSLINKVIIHLCNIAIINIDKGKYDLDVFKNNFKDYYQYDSLKAVEARILKSRERRIALETKKSRINLSTIALAAAVNQE